MPRDFSRRDRLAAELVRLLNELLLAEVKDPRLDGVRITRVELSGDLSVAKVFFSTLSLTDDPKPAAEAFARAGGFLRSRIGRQLRIRKVPELRFAHDESARRAMEVTRLIDEVAPREAGETDSGD